MKDPDRQLFLSGIVLDGVIFLLYVIGIPFCIALAFGWRP